MLWFKKIFTDCQQPIIPSRFIRWHIFDLPSKTLTATTFSSLLSTLCSLGLSNTSTPGNSLRTALYTLPKAPRPNSSLKVIRSGGISFCWRVTNSDLDLRKRTKNVSGPTRLSFVGPLRARGCKKWFGLEIQIAPISLRFSKQTVSLRYYLEIYLIHISKITAWLVSFVKKEKKWNIRMSCFTFNTK